MAEKMLLHTIIPSSTHSFLLFSPSILLSFPPVEFRWAGVLGWSGSERLILWMGLMPKPNMVAQKNQSWQKCLCVCHSSLEIWVWENTFFSLLTLGIIILYCPY